MLGRSVLTVGAAVIFLAGCGSAAARTDTDSSSKYTQTWAKDYASTSCDEWLVQMTDKQQWVAAADMLTGARDKSDGGEGLPSDDLVTEFQGGVTNVCGAPAADAEPITEIAAGLYETERDTFAP